MDGGRRWEVKPVDEPPNCDRRLDSSCRIRPRRRLYTSIAFRGQGLLVSEIVESLDRTA